MLLYCPFNCVSSRPSVVIFTSFVCVIFYSMLQTEEYALARELLVAAAAALPQQSEEASRVSNEWCCVYHLSAQPAAVFTSS